MIALLLKDKLLPSKTIREITRNHWFQPTRGFHNTEEGIFQRIFGKAFSAIVSDCIACSWEITMFFHSDVFNIMSGEGDG